MVSIAYRSCLIRVSFLAAVVILLALSLSTIGEVAITLGITAAALFVFGWFARILPIHEELPPPQTRPHPAAQPAGALRGAEGLS